MTAPLSIQMLGAEPETTTWKAIGDVAWTNIVHHPRVLAAYHDTDEAVAEAVKLTEAKCRELNVISAPAPLSPAWCASVDAELDATAAEDARPAELQKLLSNIRVAAYVIENLPELPGHNGSVLTIDDTEAARISKELCEVAEFLAAQPVEMQPSNVADLFWEIDDGENSGSCIEDLIYERDVGEELVIGRTMELSSIRIRVIAEPESAAGIGYQVIGELKPPTIPLHTVGDAAPSEATVQAVRDAVAAALGDAYDCTRVWSAWGVGTMDQDDFQLVSDDSERVAEIADAAIAALRAPAVFIPLPAAAAQVGAALDPDSLEQGDI